jgi:enterochelin esterase-like enzyme
MRKVWLTFYLVTPVVLLVVLLYWIASGTGSRERNAMPPVGAGAGDTGGANAIGEIIAGAKRPPEVRAVNGAGEGGAREESAAGAKLVDPATLEQGFILVVEDKAKRATASSPIFIAGNFNNWNPGDKDYQLTPQSDMRWRIHLTKPASRAGATDPLAFKFTRGSWKLEELKPDMSAPGNRTLPRIDVSGLKAGEIPTIEMQVAHWGDERPDFQPEDPTSEFYRPVQATGTVRRLQVQGGAGSAPGQARDLLVWLPPGYDLSANRELSYPVLYLHDGQNIFEKRGGVPGEWRADEIATELIEKGDVEPMIIVGVPISSGAARRSEYLPVPAIPDTKPDGARHVAWLVGEVMPRVERAFRVKTGPASTGIGGASMGSVISMYAYQKHPDKFGKLLAESTPFLLGDQHEWKRWTNSIATWHGTVFVGVSLQEYGPERAKDNEALLEATREFHASVGKGGARTILMEGEGVHNEIAWADRFDDALRLLFPHKREW